MVATAGGVAVMAGWSLPREGGGVGSSMGGNTDNRLLADVELREGKSGADTALLWRWYAEDSGWSRDTELLSEGTC